MKKNNLVQLLQSTGVSLRMTEVQKAVIFDIKGTRRATKSMISKNIQAGSPPFTTSQGQTASKGGICPPQNIQRVWALGETKL